MKRNRLIQLACLAAVTVSLMACSQDELLTSAEGAGTAVTFTATGIAMPQVETRATVDGTWDDALSVAIKIGNAVKEYTATPYADEPNKANLVVVEGETPFYWTTTTETKTVNAWYPYTAGETSMPAEVVVQQDQSIEANYLASDLLSATPKTVSYDDTALEFKHRTAKISIHLEAPVGSTATFANSQVLLYNLSITNGNPANILCYSASDDGSAHHALVAPQTFAANKEFLRLILADRTVHNYVQGEPITFEAGYQYVFTITLTDTGIKVTVDEAIPWGNEVSSENGIEVIETDDYICYDVNGQRHYYVKTEAGLKVWAEYVSAGNTSTNCTLMNDINLTPNEDGSSNWPHITSRYTGTFDGAGHQVDYVTMKETGNRVDLGFITRLTGTVKNLTIGKNSTFVSPDGEATGSVVGGLFEGGRIINCHSYASVTGHRIIGGIVGRIGYNTDQAGNLVVGCSFSGTISYDSGSHVYDKLVGGIVGFSYCNQTNDVGYNILNTLHVVGCYHTGSINITSERSNDCIGGIAGNLTTYNYGKLVYVGCYSTDALSSAGTIGEIGALVGRNNSLGTSLSACYWSNYLGEGLGTGTSILEVSNIGLVDNETINWTTATENMNAAIKEWNAAHDNLCPYHYKQTNGTDNPPTLVDGMP